MKKMIKSLVAVAPLAALLVVLPAQAQYKVVYPDGRTTYTDTPPPPSSGAKVTKLGENASVVPQTLLPLELRTVASRYPVTLFTTKTCAPCDTARAFLRQRGVPYSEKTIISTADVDALERLTGARQAPSLTIGAQALQGFAADTWGSYLDTAGYPRESKLPATYQNPAATPLTEPPQTAKANAPDAKPAEVTPAIPQQQTPGGIRF
jgi:glutaredoxin